MSVQVFFGAIIVLIAVIAMVSNVSGRRRRQNLAQLDWSREAGGRPIQPAASRAGTNNPGGEGGSSVGGDGTAGQGD